MELKDKLIVDAVKAEKDAQLSKGIKDLADEKINAYLESGIELLLSSVDSVFNDIKALIGKFSALITNSANIIRENSDDFFNKATEGFEKIPEDLKDIEVEGKIEGDIGTATLEN